LLGWWKLAETEGACAPDASGSGIQARLEGPPRWTTAQAPAGGAVELDGVSNYLECPSSAEFGTSERLSLAVWFKARDTDKSDQRVQSLIAKGQAWQLLRRASDGAIELLLTGPVTAANNPTQARTPRLISKRNLADGQWHHAAGTYDGRRAVLYIDGTEEASVAASGQLALTTAPLTLGASLVELGSYFNGWLADARIYRRALGAEDVRAVYQARQKP
jgi:Concanavalin A-like lectin/glucanases superfamily